MVELGPWLRDQLARRGAPLFAGLDGRSGSGKSTAAAQAVAALASEGVRVCVIDGDGFYAGGSAARWDRRTPTEKADQVIDWRRQRAVLTGLRDWGVATWHPFDWDAEGWDQDPPPFTDDPTTVERGDIVLLEGTYSCRPELHDLLDLRVLIDIPRNVRRARLLAREGEDHEADWDARWAEAEAHYFATVMPPARFDLVLTEP